MINALPRDRRGVLRAVGSLVLALTAWPFLSFAEDDPSLEWPTDNASDTGTLRITVRLPQDNPPPASIEVLMRVDDTWERISPGPSELQFERILKTGQTYEIRVVAPGYGEARRTVRMTRSRQDSAIGLVPNGWLYYLMGGVEMPVKSRPYLAAVAMAKVPKSSADLQPIIAAAAQLGFKRVTKNPETGAELDHVNHSVLYFESADLDTQFFSFDPGIPVSPVAVEQLLRLFAPYDARVGSPVRMRKGAVRLVDSQYLIRFPKPTSQLEVDVFAKKVTAVVVQLADPKGGFWLIRFLDPQNLGRHLHTVAELVKSGALFSGEPDLLFQLLAHACTGPAGNDPYEVCQGYLSRQRVDDAWCYIDQNVPNLSRYGSPSIRVATIDEGVTFATATRSSTHHDVDPGRLGYCYDLQSDLACSGTPPAIDHGMASYGIISAKPDNERGMIGMAPNVSHSAVAYTSIWASTVYAQALLWVGGVRLLPPDAKPNATCPIPPADIISCSHGLEGDPVPGIVDSALKQLTCEGRGGLGTVVVYSAGNRNAHLPSDNELATHPHTIGVGNTHMLNGKEVRHVDPFDTTYGSNFGDGIDLCANGHLAVSLTADPLVPGPLCNGSTLDTGVFYHQGTSAAAPMVSAAAALVLSVNPRLTWEQVRAVLCASAQKIDCGNTDPAGEWTWRGTGTAPPKPNPCSTLPRGLRWFSKWYGYGRLDVLSAVKSAHLAKPKPAPSCEI